MRSPVQTVRLIVVTGGILACFGNAAAKDGPRDGLVDPNGADATSVQLVNPGGPEAGRLPPASTFVSALEPAGRGRAPALHATLPYAEPEQEIVRVRRDPLVRAAVSNARATGTSPFVVPLAATRTLALEHARVAADIVRVASRLRGHPVARSEVIRRELSKVFNRFATLLSRQAQDEIRWHPGLLEVFPNVEMTAPLGTGVPSVGASGSWTTYGFAGAAAVIAVVDSRAGRTQGDPGVRPVPPRGPSDRARSYDEHVREAAIRYGLDPNLIRAVIDVESRGDPRALSPAGARGLMQVMPATALGLGVPPHLLWDLRTNVLTGTRYLRQQLDTFGNLQDALVAYSRGPEAVWRGRRFSPEGRAYLPSVLSRYRARGADPVRE
jgi:hypothetical protein